MYKKVKTRHHNGHVYEVNKYPYGRPCLGGQGNVYGRYSWRVKLNGHGYHYGVDLGGKAYEGTPIFASGSGVVSFSGYFNSGYGNQIIIDHGKNAGWNLQSTYSHLHKRLVQKGQKVRKGQIIALMGGNPVDRPWCGSSTEAHLHFEFRINGRAVDPMVFLSDTFFFQIGYPYSRYYKPSGHTSSKRLAKSPFLSQGRLNGKVITSSWMLASDLMDLGFGVPKSLINENGYSPIRDVAELNGFDVCWEPTQKYIILTRKATV